MSERTFPEQICAVLVLELGISKREVERFLEFHNGRGHKFTFKDGSLNNGYFLRSGSVGIDPAKRKALSELIKKVNGLISDIKETEFRAIKEAHLTQVA